MKCLTSICQFIIGGVASEDLGRLQMALRAGGRRPLEYSRSCDDHAEPVGYEGFLRGVLGSVVRLDVAADAVGQAVAQVHACVAKPNAYNIYSSWHV